MALLLILFTVPFLRQNYIFDWDQANDYEAVEKIASGKLTLIGPRVTSDSGFFLSPWYYYFLLPFYLFCKGSLYMGFWGALLVQYLFCLAVYILFRKRFGELAAGIAAIIFATPNNLIAWGFLYVPLLSLLFFWASEKIIDKPKLLPYLYLFFGFGCSTYAVFYALGIPLLYITWNLWKRKKINIKEIFTGMMFWTIPFFPLIIFDLRHNFLNLKNILGFFGNQHGGGSQVGYFLTVFFRAIETSWLGRELGGSGIWVIIFSIVVLIAGVKILFEKKKQAFVCWWLISSLIPMAFFKGNVSEYYYAPVIILIPIFIAGILVKYKFWGKLMLIILTIIIVSLKFKDKYVENNGIMLEDKMEVVRQLEKLENKYSISFELKLGEDSGYKTIFRKIGKNYLPDGSGQLYTITYRDKIIEGEKFLTTKKLAVYKR